MSFDNIQQNMQSDEVSKIRIFSFTINKEVAFSAFITNFSDQFTSNWTSQEIYGRMDPVYMYKNTVRKITLGFDVVSETIELARENAYKADFLSRALYPIYEMHNAPSTTATPAPAGTALIKSPPLFRIKYSNLIAKAETAANFFTSTKTDTNNPKDSTDFTDLTAQNHGLLGWIDGFTYKPEFDAGSFINRVKTEETDNGRNFIYPKLFKVSFNFNVIHEHPLGYKIAPNGNHISRMNSNSKLGFPRLYPSPQTAVGSTTIVEVPTNTTVIAGQMDISDDIIGG